MNNLLIAIAVFVITIVGALFAIPYFVDWNGYRGVFEEEATRLFGREVRVSGPVNLHLLPTPYFRFEKVRIADTSATLSEPFFRADSLTIKLSIPPMVRGVVEANEIEFERPVLRLALDDKDGWNWQSFSQALASAAYMPSNVALSSLKIANGVLAVHGPDGNERTRFEGLNGELSTPALDGPYRFRGTFGAAGAEREIRIGTSRPESDGSVRFRASLRFADTGSAYLVDARFLDLMGKPRIDGELTARLPITGLWQTAPPAAPVQKREAGSDDEPKPDRSEAAFDVKAAIKADAAGAVLSDLALSFEQDGRPQLVTGKVQADWRDVMALDMSFASRWLDLDRIAGAAEGAGPVESIVKFAARVRDLLPVEGRSRATFTIDQANLGHEPISAVRLSLVRSADKLEVQEFRLGMPGGSRGELQGVISGAAEALAFEGSLGLRGTSVVRFLAWAMGNAVPADAKSDGAFGVRAQVAISPGRAAARQLVGDLSGTALYGTAQYRWEGRPELSLLLESPQLDARAFVPAGAGLADILDYVMHGPSGKQAAGRGLGAGRTGWRGAQTDVLLRVNAGQVITAARTWRDVAAEIELKGGHLRLPLLRLSGDDGYSLELEGLVEDAASRPKGSLRGVLIADTAAGIAPLAELLGIPEALRPDDRRAQALVPLRLAGSMAFGSRTATSGDLVLDGEANGAAVKLSARFDGSAGGWRNGPADVTVAVDAAEASRIAALLVPGGAGRTEGAGPGSILVKAGGVPSEGLAIIAAVEAGDVTLGFRGQVALTDGGTKTSGDLEIKAGDGTRIAALAGLAPPLRLDGLPIAGSLRFSHTAGAIGIDRLSLKVGGSTVRGQIALTPMGERRRVEARLDFDELAVAKLFTPLLDQRLAAVTGMAEAALSGRQSLWPDEPFNAAVLDGFEGQIQLTSKRLVLADGIALGDAKLDIVLDAGKVDVKEISGSGLGGQFSGQLQIEKAPAGSAISGMLRLTEGKLEALAGDASRPRAIGSMSGVVEFSGRGTSPRAMLSALQGKGTLELGEAKLANLWPGAIAVAVDAALKVESDKLASTLRQGLIAGLPAGVLPLGPNTFALEIGDGQLRIRPFAIDTAEGRASGSASLDLRALNVESEWRLEQRPPAAGSADKPLPAVTVAYRGPIVSLSALEPRIVSDALEKEIGVRKLEREVEELERVRRLDEQRRRIEADRLRQQFEQPRSPSPPGVPVAPAGEPRPAPG